MSDSDEMFYRNLVKEVEKYDTFNDSSSCCDEVKRLRAIVNKSKKQFMQHKPIVRATADDGTLDDFLGGRRKRRHSNRKRRHSNRKCNKSIKKHRRKTKKRKSR